MKSAQQSAQKFVERAAVAAGDYVSGAQQTSKDQSQAAIAAAPAYQAGVQAAIARGAFQKGLQKSGKQGWLDGVQKKGADRFAPGVQASADVYATNSGKYDAARGAASSLPRGPRGSQQNYARSSAVGQALNKLRTGSTA